MFTKLVISAVLLFLCSGAIGQAIHRTPEVLRFMGHEVIITNPKTEADGYVPKGSASICIEGLPQRQCYAAHDQYGDGQAELVEPEKNMPALLFRADAVGATGASLQFALLRPVNTKDLEDLFPTDIMLSNQSEHEFWTDPVVSAAKIFVTADFVWGPDEAHYSPHRYLVSAYVLRHQSLPDDTRYFLEDRSMTARSYDYEKAHILTLEKPEIVARLRRLKASTKTIRPPPHSTPGH